MHVIRPRSIRGTPQSVATDLRTQTRFYPNERHPRAFDYTRDFFMTPVAPQHVTNAPDNYHVLWNFLTRNKYGQRRALEAASIPVPRVAQGQDEARTLGGERFVVRPLRHSRGLGYRVTSDRLDFAAGTEYISELYPKRREYRVIFVFGQPLIWLRKKPNEGIGEEEPWGHINSRFQTINDVPASPLSRTDCVARLAACPVVQLSHIVAADILFNHRQEQPYVVLELNNCPALDIDNNRAKVVEAIRGR